MDESNAGAGPGHPDDKIKDKKKKTQKEDKPKAKRTRRHFREEAQRARADEIQHVITHESEPLQSESADSLSPSAIVEMFHLQDENSSITSSVETTARYLVENEVSGDFYQVRTRQRKQTHLPTHSKHRPSLLFKAHPKHQDESTIADDWKCWAMFQRDGEKAAVITVLGIVAGMCWMDALNLRAGSTTPSTSEAGSFVCAYSAGANRSRQSFFVLFNGVLIGLMRKLSLTNPRQEYKRLGGGGGANVASYRLLQSATALITVALLVLLIGSPSALMLSREHQANAKWCEDVAPTSTRYQREFLILQACAILNTMLITTAWLLVALQCSMTASSIATTQHHVAELQHAHRNDGYLITLSSDSIHELQGSHLDGLSDGELKTLIQLHQHAIDQTESALVSKLQAQHRPTTAV